MMRRTACTASLAALATLFSTAALAHVGSHVGDHSHMGFVQGFAHPFSGIDHLLAMVAVGLWASQIGGRALWLLPLTFPAAMLAGAALGLGGVTLPGVEIGITVSVLVLGVAVALTYRPSLAVSLPLIALFAGLHGYAHGTELPASASALTYCAGFIVSTLGLHLTGIATGLLATSAPVRFVVRGAGGAIAATGLVLLVTV
jgi:urease accessory protein